MFNGIDIGLPRENGIIYERDIETEPPSSLGN